MSAQGPSNPFDRPRMAEALASLKEGLRDTADPLYDGWKLRSRSGQPEVHRTEGAAHPPGAAGGDPPSEAAPTIEISFDELPHPAPMAGAESASPDSSSWYDDGLPTQDELMEDGVPLDTIDEAAADDARRASVQADTVRVRVIPYQPFPRWALVFAAALFVFAVSVLALRVTFPREKTRSQRSVLASDVPTRSHVDRAASPVSNRAVVAAPPAVLTPPPPEAPSSPATPEPPLLREIAAPFKPPTPTRAPAAAVSALPSAVKVPTPPPRRRPSNREFFRDPGF